MIISSDGDAGAKHSPLMGRYHVSDIVSNNHPVWIHVRGDGYLYLYYDDEVLRKTSR